MLTLMSVLTHDSLETTAQARRSPQRSVSTDSLAVVFEGNGQLSLETLQLRAVEPEDALIDVLWSGISTGTERLLWSGQMPAFPGMGYPLVPGYESVGIVAKAPQAPDLEGCKVFVPGSNGFADARALFGATASRLVTQTDKLIPLPEYADRDYALLALAATAQHAVAIGGVPELIVGHGVLGRLIARIAIAEGGQPTVWEASEHRRDMQDYQVIAPEDDAARYATISDASGDSDILDALIARAKKGAAITLAGFYPDRLSFAFPPAFMAEVRFAVAAEWTRADMDRVLAHIEAGRLSLAGLISHRRDAEDAEIAYRTAFEDPACLKLVLDWRHSHDHAY